MSWGEDWNGGPSHRGKCPECGAQTYTCYDELCESCCPDELDEVTEEELDEYVTNFKN